MTTQEQLKLWQNKGGQIEWRLAAAREVMRAMERDLAECDWHFKTLKSKLKAREHSDD